MSDLWRPMEELADAGTAVVDLLVKAASSRGRFRVPDCYFTGTHWFSRHYRPPLQTVGWEPVAWMPVPPIPSEEEVRACPAAE